MSAGTHKPAEAVQQIDEPQAEALRLADECDESATHWVHEIDTRLKAAKMLRAQHARIAELEAQVQRAPLTYAQIKEGRNAVNDDPDDRPEPWAFREGVKFAERMHGITQEKQG